MSGETEERPSGWTVDTLRVHLERLINEQSKYSDERFRAADKAVEAALLAAEKAVNKAETAAARRFEAVNEFRGQLADQAATLMPRNEAETRINAMSEKLNDLSARVDKSAGAARGGQLAIGYVITAVTVVIAIGGVLIALLAH